MILFLFVLAAIGFFYHRVLDRHGRARTIGSIATGLVIIAAVCALAANDLWHFGMHETTTTTRTAITGAVVAKPLGTAGKTHAYLLTVHNRQTLIKPGLTTTTSLHQGGTARAALVRRDTHLRFNSSFAAVMYAGSGLQNKRIARHYQLELPANWRVVTQ